MVKIEGLPPYAPAIVLGGALATIWMLQGGGGGGGGNTSSVRVDVNSNSVPVPGATVTLVGIAPGTTDASGIVTFTAVPYGTYTLNVTASGFSDFTQSVQVNTPTMGIGVNLSNFTPPAAVALSNGAATVGTLTFTSVVTNATGTVGITYVYSVHNTAGQPVDAGNLPEQEADGTYNLTINLPTALTVGSTYTCIVFPTDGTTGTSLGQSLQFSATITGGGGGLTALAIAAGAVTATAETVRVTATPATFSGTVALRDSSQVLLSNVSITAGRGTVSVTRTAADQIVHASFNPGTGLITSNPLTIPALGTGGGLTALALTAGTLSATAEAVVIAATPITFSGPVALIDQGGATLSTVTVTSGRGNGSVTRVATRNQIVHAHSGTVDSNTLTIPAVSTASPTVVLSNGSANATSITFTRTVTNAPAFVPGVQFFAAIHSGSPTGPVATSATQTTSIINGTQTHTFSWNGSVTTLPAGTYFAAVQASDNGGNLISNTLTFSFTVSGGGGNLAVVINGAIGNVSTITATITVSGAPTPALEIYNYSVRNNLGQPVRSGAHNVQHANGTFTDSFTYAGGNLPTGTYNATLFMTDSVGGSISGTLNFTITV